MQILVVVANTQVRTLRAEVEKGFLRTAFDQELVGPKARINLVNAYNTSSAMAKSLVPSAERESGLTFLNLISEH